jgi:DNA-directed RNA polymerase specialized sigma24 family protein
VFGCIKATLAKYFYRHLQDDDMAQEIAIHIFKVLDRIDLDDHPLSFAITCIRNHAAHYRRSQMRFQRMAQMPDHLLQ